MIQSFNGQTVTDFNSLRNHVADAQPGSNATVGIVRDGAEKTVPVKLDEAEVSKRSARNAEPASVDKAALGIGVERGPKGLVITQVNPDSRAADAGLQEGDVILEVNRQAGAVGRGPSRGGSEDDRSSGAAARRARRPQPVRHGEAGGVTVDAVGSRQSAVAVRQSCSRLTPRS